MKKGIIVLLVMTLVAGYAFAGSLKGYAEISAGVDTDAKTWGIANDKEAKYSFKFAIDTTAVEVGEHQTDVWAELAAEASAQVKVTDATATGAIAAANIKIDTLKISKANIHVGEVTFGILDAGKTTNYAASYRVDDDDDPIYDIIDKTSLGQGFTVSYKGYNGGFAANGDFSGDYYIAAAVETKSYDVAEGVTAQAAGYVMIDDAANQFGGSAKAAYAAEKLSASVAADVEYTNAFAYEIAADAAYDFVSAYAYFNSDEVLEAKVECAYDVTVSDVDVALTAYVDGADLLDKTTAGREVTVGATEECTISGVKVEAYEDFAIMAKALDAGVKVSYAFEKCNAYASVDAKLAFSADPALTALVVKAGVSSDKIVENATLACEYATKKNVVAFKDSTGAVTASAKISFK